MRSGPTANGSTHVPASGQGACCPFCTGALASSPFAQVTDQLGVSKKPWNFYRCQRCGSAILRPLPAAEELAAAYPEVFHLDQAPQEKPTLRVLHLLETALFYRPLYRRSVRQLQRVIGLRGGKLLDAGGGSGHRAAVFRQGGFSVTVLDPDARALAVAREKFGLPTLRGTLPQVDLPEASLDVVTLYFVLEHLTEPELSLAAAYKLLRAGGWLAVAVPLVDSWQAKLLGRRWVALREAPRHVAVPSAQGMRQLLQRCGFAVRCCRSAFLWDNAAALALSLLPASRTPHACIAPLPVRLFWRASGALTTLVSLPFAALESLAGRPRAGVFYAQKPSAQSDRGDFRKTTRKGRQAKAG